MREILKDPTSLRCNLHVMKLTLASVQAADPCNSHPMKTQNISISSVLWMSLSFSVNLCLLSPSPVPHPRHKLTHHSWLVVWLMFHRNGTIQCMGSSFVSHFFHFLYKVCETHSVSFQMSVVYSLLTTISIQRVYHYGFICSPVEWTLWLSPVLGCESSFCEHPCVTAYVDTCCVSTITVTSRWWCVLKITYSSSLPACFLLPFTLN